MGRIHITQPTEQEIRELDVMHWPTWSSDVDKFDWSYDERETCYILQGRATVTAGDERVEVGPGDLVVFPAGMDCVWDVTRPIKKHYRMG